MICYILRTIAAEILEAIKDLFMCKKSGQCQTEKTLAMDCSDSDIVDCQFDSPIPTVADIKKTDIVGDPVLTNEVTERILRDMKDGSYTKERKAKGTY